MTGRPHSRSLGHQGPSGYWGEHPLTWATTTEREFRERAELRCTAKQLDVLKLVSHGYGYQRIGKILGISRGAARDRFDAGIANVKGRP